jgi:preprotein translocase subunit SecA
MFKGLLSKVVGDPNERQLRKLEPLVEAINALEADMERRTDAELRGLTERFRARLVAGETLDDLAPEAFAAVREASKRTVDMRPFDVQLIGGIVLHQGKVAEMRTGEGKTLVATMPIYLNALLGRGAHLITVNDYLARRDALWMAPVYHLLGLSIGLLQSGVEQPAYIYDPGYRREPYPGLRPAPRREAYAADITYGTNNEFGFDYLRDNLALSLAQRVQRPLYYAIVDEVDNIFIDEARTPLIISGSSDEPVEEYTRFATIARVLEKGVHYELDEKERSVFLSDEGLAEVERQTGIDNIYDEANYRYVHYMEQALKAHVLFQEGRDYIRQRKQIVLIDQHTGRLMPDRRLSEGLHQAIEAKEAVPIRPRDVVSATVTIQNYFRMYEKLAGMSGTAMTEAEEFFKIYKLDVVTIPTNKPMVRADQADVVYRSEDAKLRAVAREILACHSQGQPVLVGTTSVELSERVSGRLAAERLQMAALSPRIAYALQEADLDREARAELRQTLNASLETMNSAAWRKLAREVGVDANALAADNLTWIAGQLDLPADPSAPQYQAVERALRSGISHQILNAKEHTREATIIARAGEPGTVTIATNMAGRGVDIRLGGELSEEVLHKVRLALQGRGLDPFNAMPAQVDSAVAEVVPQYAKNRDLVLSGGGLHILGTERHEARRIDNQLRGRAGRQGEPGSSRFYLSLEDDLMRRFGRREMIGKLMETIGDDIPIEHGLVSRVIAQAQTAVEGYNFEIRKHLLEYDDVLNMQRQTIYDERLRVLRSDDLQAEAWRMLEKQVDEYLEKSEPETGRQASSKGDLRERRQDGAQPNAAEGAIFIGLDDLLPLTLPAPSAPFQGPVAFGSQATAFPPFTISFLADQLAAKGQPVEEVQHAIHDLARQAAADWGERLRETVSEIAQTTRDKYDESLARYQSLLDEKIGDYEQLNEERGRALDMRGLVQHLERTFPFRLAPPSSQAADLDEVRDEWQEQVEIQFHRGTCLGLMDRIQARLPVEIRLDRVKPAYIAADRAGDEVHRVIEMASKQAEADGRRQLERLAVPANPTSAEVAEIIATIKVASDLDYGRMDRLVGHVLGSDLDDLMGRYQEAAGKEAGRLVRDLERLRETVAESKKGGRLDLISLLRQLNDMVHLELEDLEALLSQAVGHEYDKWAQRQLSESGTIAARTPLANTTWAAIAEHLLAIHYTQRQAYDRDHRRRATWMPRFPFSLMAQALVREMEPEELRDSVLESLHWAVEQREQTWGQSEFKRWAQLSLGDLDQKTRSSLARYLGARELGDQRDSTVEELDADLQDRLRFILALRSLQQRHVRLGELPQAETVLADLSRAMDAEMLDKPVGELDGELQERIAAHLRRTGTLDDPAARAKLVEQPIRDWDRRTRDEVAAFLGGRFVEAEQDQRLIELEPAAREVAIAYLQRQRYFVDEARVQHFLVHERLSDLPGETRRAAIALLARTRLDHMAQRKISNLDVDTRQVILTSLQQAGFFTDQERRDQLLGRRLGDLDPALIAGVKASLAREQWGDRCLRDLGDDVRRAVVERLAQMGLLTDPDRVRGLTAQRLGDLDGAPVGEIREELLGQLRADLASKTMEELPAATNQMVRQALLDRGYFVDEAKASWYERKTLAQLPPEVLRGLEQCLGQIRMAELTGTPFRDLPAETQNLLIAFFDQEGLLHDRAERLRLTQTGTMAQWPEAIRDAVTRHLGRRWLVQIRDRRPPALPDEERNAVWTCLQGSGYFNDSFKEELFSYQRLNEFDAEIQRGVESDLVSRLTRMLETQPIGDLPQDAQATIRAWLTRVDYLIDANRQRQVEESPAQELPPPVRQAIEGVLAEMQGPNVDEGRLVGDLAPQAQAALWRHLDEIGYFIDENKRTQILGRRLADLGSEQYEQVVRDIAWHLDTEVGDRPVAELADDLRQGLRDTLETQGYFDQGETQAERVQILNQPLASLRREDLEPLAAEFGQAQLRAWAGQETQDGHLPRLSDLAVAEREAILAHLQSRDWFLDQGQLGQFQRLRVRDVGNPELIEMLHREQSNALRQMQVANLDREWHAELRPLLQQGELGFDESEMHAIRNTKLVDLDPDLYGELIGGLGGEAMADWGPASFQNLDEQRQALLRSYLGRRIMGRIEQSALMYTISRLWIDYLTDIEDLRRGIGLEAVGQRDPLVEYKRQAFELFEELGANIRRTVVRSLFRYSPEPLRV